MRCMSVVLFVAAILCVSANATAGEKDAKANTPAGRELSITLSPFHLFMPMLELTGEYRLAEKVGAAGILGVGRYTTTVEDDFGDEETFRFTVAEVGGQVRYYLIGDFDHGMQIGAEVMYMYMDDSHEGVQVNGAGLCAGPFVGYKIITRVGFTFDAQLGVEYVIANASASDSSNSASSSGDTTITLLNLNTGWSF